MFERNLVKSSQKSHDDFDRWANANEDATSLDVTKSERIRLLWLADAPEEPRELPRGSSRRLQSEAAEDKEKYREPGWKEKVVNDIRQKFREDTSQGGASSYGRELQFLEDQTDEETRYPRRDRGRSFMFVFIEQECSAKGVFTPEKIQEMCQREQFVFSHPLHKNTCMLKWHGMGGLLDPTSPWYVADSDDNPKQTAPCAATASMTHLFYSQLPTSLQAVNIALNGINVTLTSPGDYNTAHYAVLQAESGGQILIHHPTESPSADNTKETALENYGGPCKSDLSRR